MDQEHLSLADQLIRAIQLHRDELDALEHRIGGDHPVEVRLHYHPGTLNADITLHTSFRLHGRSRRSSDG